MGEQWVDIEDYDTANSPIVVLPEDTDLTPYIDACWGHRPVEITDAQIEALKAGKKLIWSDGEYSSELRYKRE